MGSNWNLGGSGRGHSSGVGNNCTCFATRDDNAAGDRSFVGRHFSAFHIGAIFFVICNPLAFGPCAYENLVLSFENGQLAEKEAVDTQTYNRRFAVADFRTGLRSGRSRSTLEDIDVPTAGYSEVLICS